MLVVDYTRSTSGPILVALLHGRTNVQYYYQNTAQKTARHKSIGTSQNHGQWPSLNLASPIIQAQDGKGNGNKCSGMGLTSGH